MKTLILIPLLLLSYSCWCQTQMEMNQESYKAYQKVDKELNDVYKKVLKEYGSDTAFIRNLKTAQKLWIQFRDAEVNTKFSDPKPYIAYGSMYPMCWSTEMMELTEERIKKLKVYLNGIYEGSGCTGSIKGKNK
jgi:uncharacterized protein YecT (DUF1311 family)